LHLLVRASVNQRAEGHCESKNTECAQRLKRLPLTISYGGHHALPAFGTSIGRHKRAAERTRRKCVESALVDVLYLRLADVTLRSARFSEASESKQFVSVE
jgi:hypothetical protein